MMLFDQILKLASFANIVEGMSENQLKIPECHCFHPVGFQIAQIPRNRTEWQQILSTVALNQGRA